MKEFMLFVRTEGDHMLSLSPAEQQDHVQKIGKYIGDLIEKGKLKSAQPLDMDGLIISGKKNAFKDGPFNETKEVIAGYFHIVAKDIDEATEIAKANPIFELKENYSIEMRPIKTVEGIN